MLALMTFIQLAHAQLSEAERVWNERRARAAEVLGVSEDASQDDIKKAYRRILRESHSDHNRSSDEHTRALNNAADVLLQRTTEEREYAKAAAEASAARIQAEKARATRQSTTPQQPERPSPRSTPSEGSDPWTAYQRAMNASVSDAQRDALQSAQLRYVRDPGGLVYILRARAEMNPFEARQSAEFLKKNMSSFLSLNPSLRDLNQAVEACGLRGDEATAMYRQAFREARTSGQFANLLKPDTNESDRGYNRNVQSAIKEELPRFFELKPKDGEKIAMKLRLKAALGTEANEVYERAANGGAESSAASTRWSAATMSPNDIVEFLESKPDAKTIRSLVERSAQTPEAKANFYARLFGAAQNANQFMDILASLNRDEIESNPAFK